MSEISDIIMRASKESVEPETAEEYIDHSIDELYEDEPEKEQEIKSEVVKTITRIQPSNRKNVEEEVVIVDPYPNRKHQSAEAEMQDRLLTIEGRPKNALWGSLWITNSQFREQVALLNITKSEQRALMREWSDIEILSEGDGNESIVESDQNELALKIISYKSRSDNPERGIRERTAHITSKSIQDQTVTLPKSESKSGFVNQLLGRKADK
jgi:hypothetical protein